MRSFCENPVIEVRLHYPELLPATSSSVSRITNKNLFFLDWPVFNEVDNLVHKDHDRLDNQRVSGFLKKDKFAFASVNDSLKDCLWASFSKNNKSYVPVLSAVESHISCMHQLSIMKGEHFIF